ncbi:rano class II histocompatibility antigen, A beta chain-like isoform X4 [Epinephelus fuscoguttatus]|uniref:rano class II histocompatibility antigen, A beta chain-like isoform X2 n=1 Tax=Epinephelus fuscoguttatus TaxID=293821 RepID=UPI0020D1EE59|nr:rano class II histocompatibility antigen, A beta chain-like isoform X2 [Epinephelus fuscoguttatus]XP_049446428.1 rano class II histocompatibility antigen, A beta chain-like isoform X4 [Epinephelus fuscoguttatus]
MNCTALVENPQHSGLTVFNMKCFTFLLFLYLFSRSVVDCAADGKGYFVYADFWCARYSREPEQVEFLIDYYFNEEFTMQYNSTVGNWTGFTPAGLIFTQTFNKNLRGRILERKLICVDSTDSLLNAVEENMAEPNITLTETTTSSHDTMLVCSAYDFYPKHIKVTWHRNGQEVTSGVTSTEVMTNGDWTYHVHSFLEFTPGRQDRVSCVVEHISLREPKISDWDSSFNQSERSFVIGGVVALLLGAVILSSGLIHYRRRRSVI